MKLQQLKKRAEGFTIIEVLIVLAIAGLILLIVFLAVPALQRNSRNTQRSDDVARVLGAAQEVLNNNNGSLDALNDDSIQAAVGDKLAFYAKDNVSVSDSSDGAAADTDHVVVHKGTKCESNAPATGTTRQLAASFYVEGGSGDIQRCQDS